MSYNEQTISISLGERYENINLKATIKDKLGNDVSGKVGITTGFTRVGNGNFVWYYDKFEEQFVGSIVFQNVADNEVLSVVSLNSDDNADQTVITTSNSTNLNGWYDTAIQMIDDWIPSATYTATQWYRRFNLAAKTSIESSLSFASGYSLVTSSNIQNWSVSPDPSTDMDFIEFVALLAICNLYKSNISKKAMDASSVRDGSSAIDTRGFGEKGLVVSPCEQFERRYSEKYGSDNFRVRYNFGSEMQ